MKTQLNVHFNVCETIKCKSKHPNLFTVELFVEEKENRNRNQNTFIAHVLSLCVIVYIYGNLP